MDLIKYIVKNGQPACSYFDEDGNIYLSYYDENGFEVLDKKTFTINRGDIDNFDIWFKKIIKLYEENEINCLVYPIDYYYDTFLEQFYTGNDNVHDLLLDEKISIYNEIKKYEKEIKNNPNNEDLIIETLKTCEYILEYISDELKNDIDFAIKVVNNSKLGLQFLDSSIKNNKEVVMTSVRKNGLNISACSDELKKDFDIALEAIKNNKFSYNYIGDELKNDVKFKQLLKKENIDIDEIKSEINKIMNILNGFNIDLEENIN